MSAPEIRTAVARTEPLASRLGLLEAWAASALAYRDQPGCTVGLVHDQELVWARGFGLADREAGRPADPDTLYRIASISKLFTSLAILQLRDRGLLRLDEPLQTYLPWFSIQGREPGSAEVTLRGILTHTSGLPREAAFPYWSENTFPDSAALRATVGSQTLAHQPDTRWKYSNLGFALAGEVVEAVAGQGYAAYLQEHLLGPLGMESTTVEVPEANRSRLAVGYGRRLPDGTRPDRPFSDTQGIAAAGGLSSSVRDLARFAAFLFHPEGRGVLRLATLREMQRVHWLRPDWQAGWGLGFSILRQPDRDLVGHGGWLGGYQSSFTTSPRERIAVIVLGNADDFQPYPGRAESVPDRIWNWVAPVLRQAVTPPTAPARPDPAWERYLGLYRSPWGDRQVLILDGRLTMIAPNEAEAYALRVTLVPVGEHTFRTVSEAPFGEDGDLIRFELDPEGRVARVWTGENWTLPVR